MDVRIPKFGMSTVEVDIVRVLVVPGQHVRTGDPIVQIEGEKSTIDLEAECSGTVTEVFVREGETHVVADLVCRIEED